MGCMLSRGVHRSMQHATHEQGNPYVLSSGRVLSEQEKEDIVIAGYVFYDDLLGHQEPEGTLCCFGHGVYQRKRKSL